MQYALTEKQNEILHYLVIHKELNGEIPFMIEVATAFGVAKSTMYQHYQQIAKKGWISLLKHTPRGLIINFTNTDFVSKRNWIEVNKVD